MAATGGDVIGLDWRIPLDAGWELRRARPRRPGQPRPGCPARSVRAGPGGDRSGSSSGPAAVPATSSTSATASSRRPIPTRSAGWSSSCTSAPPPSPHEDRGRPDGVRQPIGDRRHPRVSRRHPRGKAGLRARGRGARRALPAHRRSLAARRGHRGAARRARARARPARLRRDEALAAADRRGGGRGTRRRGASGSSASCSRRTTRDCRSPATAPVWRTRSAIAAELVFIESWHDHEPFLDVLADRVRGTDAHVVFTAHSLPERILREGDPYRDQLLETSRLVAERAGLDAGRSRSRAPARPASPGSGPTSSRSSTALRGRARKRCWSARSGSSPTISRSSGTSTSRPRVTVLASSVSSSNGSTRSTTIPLRARPRRLGSTGPFSTLICVTRNDRRGAR